MAESNAPEINPLSIKRLVLLDRDIERLIEKANRNDFFLDVFLGDGRVPKGGGGQAFTLETNHSQSVVVHQIIMVQLGRLRELGYDFTPTGPVLRGTRGN